jgi:chorismate synthase
MPGNSFGDIFRVTTFGESHGPAIGGVIDGCPPGILFNEDFIQQNLLARNPSSTAGSTTRKEDDLVEWLSGIYEGQTTGAPLAFVVRNSKQASADYDHLKDIFRPSHGDYAIYEKYGIRDHRGGGRLSGRETVSRVVAGSVAKLVLQKPAIDILAWTTRIGPVEFQYSAYDMMREQVYNSPVRCPDESITREMENYIDQVRKEGDTAGGLIDCRITGVPPGLGEPVFDKLEADLAKAMLSIGGVKGFEIGTGFASSKMKGSQHNDPWVSRNGKITTETNHSGGVQGGMSNGEDILFRIAVKPLSSIQMKQTTVDSEGNRKEYISGGRHDVTIVPRLVPVVESMAAIVVADHHLRQKTIKK